MPRASKARPFKTLDAETDPFKPGRVPKPFIWGVYDGASYDYLEFTRETDLVDYVSEQDCIFYAHNGGRFDFHYLRQWIATDEPIMVISGRLASFKIGKAEFRDSMNILVNPLRAFSKEEIDYAKLEPGVRDQHMPEIKRYLQSDCVNLWDAIKRYFDDYGRSLTQAGAAMNYWKKKYKFPMQPQTACQSEKFRAFYYGGRVECFVTGHALAPFSVVDINSAYPRAMREPHPISPDARRSTLTPKDSKLSRSSLTVECISRGAFPYRGEDRRLRFPDDGVKREYQVSGWEFIAALELNLIREVKVVESFTFTHTVSFADYVDFFWQARMDARAAGDKAGDVFAKLFLNSLYGKFAADPEKYHEYILCEPEAFLRWRREGYAPVLNWGQRMLCERPLPEERHRYYNVATAGSITGWVRAYLMRGLRACSGVLYCDTDSIAARDVSGLALGDKLGEWKVEMRGSEYAIAAKKTYAFRHADDPDKWKVASKGVRLTPAEIVACAQGEEVIHAPSVPTYSVFEPVPQFVKRVIRRTGDGLMIS